MFNLFKKKEKPKPTFIELLVRTEYFEFTDVENLGELKTSIRNSYDKYQTFNTKYDKDRNPICKKAFFCDSETVFEGNGFREQLHNMKVGLERIVNFDELIKQIPESYDYQSNPKGDWFDGVSDLTDKVNDYLRKRSSKYKLYPAYGENEGSMYILNESQYLLLNKAIKDEHTRPLKLEDWITKYKPRRKETNSNKEATNNKLNVGTKIKHLKFGQGEILEISEKGVANIMFSDGEKRIILKYSKLEII